MRSHWAAIWTIARRELAAYFESPVAYVFLVIFLLLAGFFTFTAGSFFERGEASLAAFFGWHPWLYLVLVPAAGMRLWAEERRSGTLELLLTNRRLPASEALAWGLVSEVVDDDQLLGRALTFAEGLAPVPAYALRQSRRLLDTINMRDQLQLEAVAIRTAARGEVFRAALKAFMVAHPD